MRAGSLNQPLQHLLHGHADLGDRVDQPGLDAVP